MATPPPSQPPRRSSGEKKTPSPLTIVTRNNARQAKIQTRAMASTAKPSSSLIAAKKKAQQKKKHGLGDTVLKDHYQLAVDSKSKCKGATGFVTEPRMAEHKCLWDPNYPECPERLIGVIDRCKELNLLDECMQLTPRMASKEEVMVLHAPSVFDMMVTTHNNKDVAYLEELSSKYDAVYIHPTTHELALMSVGCTVDLVEAIVRGRLQNGAAYIRPPGHHAMYDEPCGYCIYNNVAIAAKKALQMGVERILIVDWDVHHGQATQQMFYDDPRIVYFSIHRYEHGSFWPNLRQSNFNYVGSEKGAGFNFNVPLNKTGMQDADYMAIWHQLLLPMAFEFDPELIIVSAGYDAAIGCPEGEMEITPACYGHLLHLLSCVCPSICVALEGGYCVQSLSEGAALTLRALLGHPVPAVPLGEPSDSIRESILNCIYTHKPYWRCYNFQPTYSIDSIPNVCDVNKVKHQVQLLWLGDETRPDRFATRDCYPVQDEEFKRKTMERLDSLRIRTDLSIPKHLVAYVYNDVMLKHKNICEPDHVECPARIQRIHERHLEFGLLSRVLHLKGRPATDEHILTVHTKQYLDSLKELAKTKLRDMNAQKDIYDSVYFHPDSLESARMAVGSVIECVECVLNGVSSTGVCVIRPPSHHCSSSLPSGFCLLNAPSVAASLAISHFALNRVLLLDWDVHHGNGTQELTYHTDKILYMSIHRYDDGSFFPHSEDANYDKVGSGIGKGFNVNIPWNKRGMGDTEYLAAFTQIVLPIAYEYNPELVIVSAGFDACIGDPLGGCKVTPECFGRMTNLLKGLAGGKIVLCLEGGYNITSISYAMTMCTKALLGDPIPRLYEKTTCHWSAIETINNVISTQKKYWKSLKFQLALPIENVLPKPETSRGLKQNGDDQSIVKSMASLKVKSDCVDGANCGSDDESKPGGSRSEEKKTLVDFLADNMQALVNEELFAIVPLPGCPHLDGLPKLAEGVNFEQGVKCADCDSTAENWVCLHCYVTACARSINGHMQSHFQVTQHPLVLSLTDLSVWCNSCDAYIDNPKLYEAKNNAHRCKFGEDMPYCYHETITLS